MANLALGNQPMQIVPILEDELLSGYRGRLANLNNCRRTADLNDLMLARFPVQEAGGQSQFVWTAAKALKVSVRFLVQEHTVWPIFAAMPDRESSSEAARSPYSAPFAHLWMKSARARLAMCPACIESDLADPALHLSYWRRSHQVPGLMHCPRHGDELQFVSLSTRLGAFPHELKHIGESANPVAVKFAVDSAVVRRTLELLSMTLHGKEFYPRSRVMHAIGERACQTMGCATVGEALRALTSLLQTSVPADWLRNLMPHYNGKRPGVPLFLQAAIVYDSLSLSAPVAAFVAALVFDSTVDAAEALLC